MMATTAAQRRKAKRKEALCGFLVLAMAVGIGVMAGLQITPMGAG